ncbi:CRISPR system Cascade subunit CasA [Thermocatellispora tengchongensis]|uniref:CRISPR system Cascade subunit CasA n=2 Tax=Thermocatellispora tengchongensis TaxID=1073253 RepID=A0A840PH38_9ACTN|nr:CRISPR system Cascade subunit CasA [Thermocatellispora tengchongensis]
MLGIVDLLERAHRLRALVSEAPPVTSALHRLLLAFLHRSLKPTDDEQWHALWKAAEQGEGFPSAKLRAYAKKWTARFDLLDPERPFLQCPGMPVPNGRSVAPLVAFRARGNNATLFDHTTDADGLELEPAEAARWLVATHAYDTGGTKPRHNGGGNVTARNPPTTEFGCVLVVADTLQRTLLLNLLPYDPDNGRPAGTRPSDRPAWEAPPDEPESDTRSPHGWTELLTWPARRIRLAHRVDDRGRIRIHGAQVSPGSTLELPVRDVEQMAAFRAPWFSETVDENHAAGGGKQGEGTTGKTKRKKASTGDLNPVRLDTVRGVWRHSQELLLPADKRWYVQYTTAGMSRYSFPDSSPERLRTRTVEHLAARARDGLFDEGTVYTLRVFGQQVSGGGAGALAAWCEEAVPMPVALLRADDARLGLFIGRAVALADDLGSVLRRMEREYRADFDPGYTVKADEDKHREGFRFQAELDYWPHLPVPFAELLRELGHLYRRPEPDSAKVITVLDAWKRGVAETADRAAEQWLHHQARTGRTLLTAARYYQRYRYARSQALKVFDRALAGHTPPEDTQ